MSITEDIMEIVEKASSIMTETEVQISEKDSCDNIVTSADVAVQSFLEKELTSIIPGSVFFGEEACGKRPQGKYCWIVDPIDGTMNFVRHARQSAVSVALSTDNQISSGVVYNPFTREMFYAEKGKGAFLNGRQIHVSDLPFEKGLLCSAMSVYNKDYAKTCMDIIMDLYMKCSDIRRFGTASLELCYIADGRCDLYFEYRLFPWDFAAASLILEEAGGKIGNPLGGFVSFEHECPVIAANNIANYNKIIETVRNYMTSVPYLN